MIVWAVDPGLKGALARLDMYVGSLLIHDMPIISTTFLKAGKKKKRNMVDAKGVFEILKDEKYRPIFIEQVSARPNQGVTSMFGFGRSLGVVIGVAAALDMPTTMVRPQEWQRATGAKGKDGSRQRAKEVFPAFADLFKLKKHDGRSDAALLAYYSTFCGLSVDSYD